MKSLSHSDLVLSTVFSPDSGPSLTVATSDKVATTVHSLWLLSPFIRSAIASVNRTDHHLIILPDFTSEQFRKVVDLIRHSNSELLVFNGVTRDILELIGIDISNYQEKLEEDMRCRFCEEHISGGNRGLRCHLISSHLNIEIEKEVEAFFGSSDRCSECLEFHRADSSRRLHVSHQHSYLVEKIDQLIQQNQADFNEDLVADIQRKMEMISDDSSDDSDVDSEGDADHESDEDDVQNQLMLCNPNLSDSEDEDAAGTEDQNEEQNDGTEDQDEEPNDGTEDQDEEQNEEKEKRFIGIQKYLLQDLQNDSDSDSDSETDDTEA